MSDLWDSTAPNCDHEKKLAPNSKLAKNFFYTEGSKHLASAKTVVSKFFACRQNYKRELTGYLTRESMRGRCEDVSIRPLLPLSSLLFT